MPGLLGKCLLLAALLLPGLAGAEQYKGHLIPGNYSPPIPIVLKLKFEGDVVTGSARASTLSLAEGRVTGEATGSLCNLTLTFGSESKANLQGHCNREGFDGEYKLYPSDGKKQTGMFNLKQEKLQAKDSGPKDEIGPQASVADCIKRNTACLTACPRGDYNTEFLCANSCRRKKLTCQAHVSAARNAAAAAEAAAPDGGEDTQ